MRNRFIVAVLAVLLGTTGCIFTRPLADPFFPYDSYDAISSSGYREAWTVSADGTHRVRATRSYSQFDQGEASSVSESIRVETITGESLASFGGTSPDIAGDGSFVVFSRRPSYDIFNDPTPPVSVFLGDVSTGDRIRMSEGVNGEDPDGSSSSEHISADGSTVVFVSRATNLVSPSTSGAQVFAYDLATGVVSLVSTNLAGSASAGNASGVGVSADGSIIAFSSDAADLIAGDSNGFADIFTTVDGAAPQRLVLGLGGAEPDADVFLADLSDDGATMVVRTEATNLVSNDLPGTELLVVGPNSVPERFAYLPDGTPASNPSYSGMSADGSLLLFSVFDRNISIPSGFDGATSWSLYNAYLHDRVSGETSELRGPGSAPHAGSARPSITADGRLVLVSDLVFGGFPGNLTVAGTYHLQAAQDVRVDSVEPSVLVAGETTRVTVMGAGFYGPLAGGLLPWTGYDASVVSLVEVEDRTSLTLDIAVPADAPLGAAGLGLSTVGPTPFGQLFLAANSCDCLTIVAGGE